MQESIIPQDQINRYPFLKKQLKMGENFLLSNLNSAEWTKENILAGLQKFFDDSGRYPTAEEIDRYPYLPSSRQIQRRFGGLVQLRKDLNFAVSNYSIGAHRSQIASKVGIQGGKTEREMETTLVNYFGEYFVHVEKPLYNFFCNKAGFSLKFKQRADFLVYCDPKPFCVDVFYPRDFLVLKKNYKHKRTKI